MHKSQEILVISEIEDKRILMNSYQWASSENIGAVIEKIVNEYDFIKTKGMLKFYINIKISIHIIFFS